MQKKTLTAENRSGLRILHTADWHLGVSLYNRSLYEESEQFLNWLLQVIERLQIDVLLVCGDIFDSKIVPLEARRLYYQFLGRLIQTSCRQIFIMAGNHDSVAFLETPRQILDFLSIHIVASPPENAADSVWELRDRNGETSAILGAVPFLRDNDVRKVTGSLEEAAAESVDQKVRLGIREYYSRLWQACLEQRGSRPLPVLLTGHLSVSRPRNEISESGMVLPLEKYTGSLLEITTDILPAPQYFALGHYHVCVPLSGDKRVRYSGSPLPVSFQEAGQRKSVIVLETTGADFVYDRVDVPAILNLRNISGTVSELEEAVRTAVTEHKRILLSLVCTDEKRDPDLLNRLRQTAENSPVEILNCSQSRTAVRSWTQTESLQEMTPGEFFRKYLRMLQTPPEKQQMLEELFHEAERCLEQQKEEGGKA